VKKGRDDFFRGIPLLKVDLKRPGRAAAERAAAVLRNGWLVILPSDTGYVLAGDARNPGAASILARLSPRRGAGAPTCLMAYGKQVLSLAEDLSESFWEASRGWPRAAVTLIIRPAPWIPDPLRLPGGKGLAVRLPDSPLVWKLVEILEWPLAAVELPGAADPSRALDLAGPASGMVRLVLDGGSVKKSAPALVDARAKYARILVQGGPRTAA
jgi:L-threonylcarbamoyladenylate synthase